MTSVFPQRRMRRAARRVLSAEVGSEAATRIGARVDAVYPEVAARMPKTGLGARDLLRTSAYTIALHRALFEHGLDADETNTLISDTVFAAILPARTALYRLAGLGHRGALERARWGAGVTRRLYYTEPDWVMHDVPVDDGFGFDVTRCAIAEFYDSFGLGELCQRAICDQDVRSAAHHGVVLDRSETLASGGERCDFRYRSPETERPNEAGLLEDTVVVEATPEEVWLWLTGLADHYCDWHPDHVSARWIRGAPNQIGSRLEAVEYLGGHRETLVFEMTAVHAPWRMEYRIVGPHSILLTGGAFEISPLGQHTVFRATIRYRFGRLTRAAFGRRFDALRSHMREEGENLKRLLEVEGDAHPAGSATESGCDAADGCTDECPAAPEPVDGSRTHR